MAMCIPQDMEAPLAMNTRRRGDVLLEHPMILPRPLTLYHMILCFVAWRSVASMREYCYHLKVFMPKCKEFTDSAVHAAHCGHVPMGFYRVVL